MMFWRKTKSEISNSISQDFENKLKLFENEMSMNGCATTNSTVATNNSSSVNNKPRLIKSNSLRKISTSSSLSIPKRVVSLKSSPQIKTYNDTTKLVELQNIVEKKRIEMLQANRKSLISIYILCRVLIEIVKQSPHDSDEHINNKLEEIIFAQLKITDPLSVSSSIIKSSNWNSFAKILGCMSEYHFVSVSDKFIAELEKFPSLIPIEDEPYVHLLVLGMRYLKLKHYPIDNFEQSMDFLKSISKFFARTENVSIRIAYADVTTQLLLSLADVVTVEINHPTWIEAMELLYKCSKTLISNTKCWSVGFTLSVSILCVSPSQLFTERWMKLLTSNIDKIKTKDITERAIYALGLSCLVWVYLYRSTETLNNTIKTLTSLLRLYLNPKKKKIG
ncbi:Tao3p PWA37_001049 [Arxiozyma heterogenica]|uniref:Tao3p n=1 Tax=Arxiozyma heterogenica TaxID=278026 RepID=UPI002EF94F5F